MRAMLCTTFGSTDHLFLEEVPQAVPASGQVLIKVEACGVSFPDLLILQNKYQFQPELPYSPGGEAAGQIVALGDGVTDWQVGDRVLALCRWGGFAEQLAVDVDRIFSIPEGISAELAASSFYTYSTSFHALKDRAQLQQRETLLVLGASGGIGAAAVELGKAMGAKVIAAASSDEKLAFCKELGADEVVNYEKENLKNQLKELTAGKGVNVVLDPVGGSHTEQALRGMAWKGRYLIVGFTAGEIPKLPMNLPLLKGCSIMGVFWGNFSKVEVCQNRQNMNVLTKWLLDGKIKGHEYEIFSLKNAAGALKKMQNRELVGKAIIKI
ncbi:NADPH:quinone oxidoreductase family protein [Algoriphagus halophytocola]|uniref:NADPH:quinone oxidoreductase family protein n=1 Tax=Algoriphagus halophytocola TaxID=2991499 RepID=A0ABY6MCT3_9BACT|nr:NADPH:quinone oxidoreductase family protein [Algoriphagus sp. TR-M5]UZD21530.1 NADPH:quinone oxidoreductase family protein [Algoriphagus sp. TR-M5]